MIAGGVGSSFGQGTATFPLGAETITRIISLTKKREGLDEPDDAYRRGAGGRIEDALKQFKAVWADNSVPPPRLKALAWALQLYAKESTRKSYGLEVRSPHVEGSVTSFAAGDYKCNKLVADAYASGAGCGLSIAAKWDVAGRGTGWPALEEGENQWPPQANHLADPTKNLRSLTAARELGAADDPKAQPELGDIIAFPSSDGLGHASLYLGKGLIISAKSEGIEIHPLAFEQRSHGGLARIRKFNGSGK